MVDPHSPHYSCQFSIVKFIGSSIPHEICHTWGLNHSFSHPNSPSRLGHQLSLARKQDVLGFQISVHLGHVANSLGTCKFLVCASLVLCGTLVPPYLSITYNLALGRSDSESCKLHDPHSRFPMFKNLRLDSRQVAKHHDQYTKTIKNPSQKNSNTCPAMQGSAPAVSLRGGTSPHHRSDGRAWKPHRHAVYHGGASILLVPAERLGFTNNHD